MATSTAISNQKDNATSPGGASATANTSSGGGTYYSDSGKKLSKAEIKKYLKSGAKFYTRDELEAKYNGFDINIIRKAGKLRGMLLEAPSEYKLLSDEELQAQADAQYAGDAATAKTLAQNQYDASVNAIKNQLSALDSTYAGQVSAANNATAQTIDNANSSAASRGLGRSSIALGLQNNAQVAGNNAVNTIMANKTQESNNLNSQLTTLGTGLGSTMATIDSNRNSAVKAALDALKANNLANYQNTSADRTTFLFNLLNQVKKNSSSKSSSRRTSTKSSSSSNSNTSGSGDFLSSLIGAISGAAGATGSWS